MTIDQRIPMSPRMNGAMAEHERHLSLRFPTATFDIDEGDDPAGIYFTATALAVP